MPLHQSVLEKYVSPTFIETGTDQGAGVNLAFILGIEQIHTIDIVPALVRNVTAHYARYLDRVHGHAGDSAEVLAKLLPTISGPITFWLDAHPPHARMTFYGSAYPLVRELAAIKEYASHSAHIILIDDLRTYDAKNICEMEARLKEYWPACKISREDGYVDNDVLVCDLR